MTNGANMTNGADLTNSANMTNGANTTNGANEAGSQYLKPHLDLVADLDEILSALNLNSSASAAFKLSGAHLKIPNFLPSGRKIFK